MPDGIKVCMFYLPGNTSQNLFFFKDKCSFDMNICPFDILLIRTLEIMFETIILVINFHFFYLKNNFCGKTSTCFLF